MSFVKQGKKGLDLGFQNGLLMSTGEKDERGLGGIGFPDRPSLGMWRGKTQGLVVDRGVDQDSLSRRLLEH